MSTAIRLLRQYYTALQFESGDMASENGSSSSGAPVSQEHLEQFLGSVTRMFAEKMDEFKRELTEEQEHSNERLAKRIRLENPPTFRKAVSV